MGVFELASSQTLFPNLLPKWFLVVGLFQRGKLVEKKSVVRPGGGKRLHFPGAREQRGGLRWYWNIPLSGKFLASEKDVSFGAGCNAPPP